AGSQRAPCERVRRALIVLAILTATVAASGEPGTDSTEMVIRDTAMTAAIIVPGKKEILPAKPRAVRAGESLRFSVNYGFINAGAAYLEVPGVREWNGSAGAGRKCVLRLPCRPQERAVGGEDPRARESRDSGRHVLLRGDRADPQGRRHFQEQGPVGHLAHRRRAAHTRVDEEQGD